ncbi:MAG: KEOPS complex subunit Pcc1 [Methanomassiliicoccus sp.]|nr:KEOPS complex subunit Pcc1 [Methanomassiliicoccus sp.]
MATPHGKAVWGALHPEVGREIPRTKVKLAPGEGEIILDIEASDLGALRAALNSYLRWIRLSEEIGNMVGEEHE